MNSCGVYKITCNQNGKVYIGSSNNVHLRISEHRRLLSEGLHHNKLLQKDYNDYGCNCFNFEVLEYCQPKDKYKTEKFYMENVFDSLNKTKGYNIATVNIAQKFVKHEKRTFTDKDIEFMKKLYLIGISINKLSKLYRINWNNAKDIVEGKSHITKNDILCDYIKNNISLNEAKNKVDFSDIATGLVKYGLTDENACTFLNGILFIDYEFDLLVSNCKTFELFDIVTSKILIALEFMYFKLNDLFNIDVVYFDKGIICKLIGEKITSFDFEFSLEQITKYEQFEIGFCEDPDLYSIKIINHEMNTVKIFDNNILDLYYDVMQGYKVCEICGMQTNKGKHILCSGRKFYEGQDIKKKILCKKCGKTTFVPSKSTKKYCDCCRK